MLTIKNYFKCIAATDSKDEVGLIVHGANEHMTGHKMTEPRHLPISNMLSTIFYFADIGNSEHWQRLANQGHDYITSTGLDCE